MLTNMDIQKNNMIKALEQSLGIVTTACKSVGIARQTHYTRMQDDPNYRQSVEELKNMSIDFAETQLFNQMKNGNVTAVIFYLKTQGKNRGYIERQELDLTSEDGPIVPFIIQRADEK